MHLSINTCSFFYPLETLIFKDGSVVRTARGLGSKAPSNEVHDSGVEGDNETPRPQGSHVSNEVVELTDDDEEPYITPFTLERKVRKAVAPPPIDTEVEDSDIEQQLRRKASKKAGAVKSVDGNLKVR